MENQSGRKFSKSKMSLMACSFILLLAVIFTIGCDRAPQPESTVAQDQAVPAETTPAPQPPAQDQTTTTSGLSETKATEQKTTETLVVVSDPKFTEGWEAYCSVPDKKAIVKIVPQKSIQVMLPDQHPKKGDYAGIQKKMETQSGSQYVLKAVIEDPYQQVLPGRLEERIYVGDKLVWNHDISGDKTYGMMPIKATFTAESADTLVRIELNAFGEIQPWSWGLLPLNVYDFSVERLD